MFICACALNSGTHMTVCACLVLFFAPFRLLQWQDVSGCKRYYQGFIAHTFAYASGNPPWIAQTSPVLLLCPFMPSQRENGVTLDSCPLEAFTCAGPGGDFFCVRCMLTAGSDAKTFSPSFCGYESECMSSSFKRLVGGAQLLRSLEWLIQPLVRVFSYPAPPLWLFECLQRCIGNRIQISEQISQPLFSALHTLTNTGHTDTRTSPHIKKAQICNLTSV